MKDALKRSLAFLLACGLALSMSLTAVAEEDAGAELDSDPAISVDTPEAVTVTEAGEEDTPTIPDAAPADEPAPEETVAEDTTTEDPAVTEEPAEEPAEEQPIEEPAAPEEEPAEEPAVPEEEQPAAPVEESGDGEDYAELVDDDEVVIIVDDDIEVDIDDLAGDPVLIDGVTTTMTIPTGTGANAKAYATFTMAQSGLLTITFKSVSIAHGNLEVIVRSANHNDAQLWGINWTQDLGTVNFSDFVDAGTYEIIVQKADTTDEASYDISATPLVTRAGEVGVRNNTVNNAGNLPVDNVEHPGIWSLQDVKLLNMDYYKVVLSSPGKLEFSFTNLTMDDLYVTLYGDDTIENNISYFDFTAPACADINEMSATTVRRSNWFDAGVYYLVVDDDSDDTDHARGRYLMKFNNNPVSLGEREANNTFNEAWTANNVLNPVNGTVVTGLLSASSLASNLGYPDYYMFTLPMEQLVDFGASIQFESVELGVYARDGSLCYYDDLGTMKPAEFGESGTPGSEGDPYMMELRNVRLPAGTYFLKVSTGGDTGLYNVWAHSHITASVLDVKVENGAIIANGIASGGSKPATQYIYQVYYQDPGTGNFELVHEQQFGPSNGTCTYYPPNSGVYQVMFAVTDGELWDNKWSDPITVTAEEFKILTIQTSVDAKGVMHLKAIYSGNAPLEDSSWLIMLGSETVMQVRDYGDTEFVYQAPVSGTYSVMFAGYMPGKTNPWQNAWAEVEVKVPEGNTPLKVLDLGAVATATRRITATALVSGGTGLKNTVFTLYAADGTTVLAEHSSAHDTTHTFVVSADGDYYVGFTAADAHTTATTAKVKVTVDSTMSVPVITTLDPVCDAAGNLSIAMTVDTGKALTDSYFEVWYSPGGGKPDKLITTLKAPNLVALGKLYHSGNYYVKAFVKNASGTATKTTNFTVSLDADHEGITLTLDSLTSPANSGVINVEITVTGCRPATHINYYLYRMTSTDPNVVAHGMDEVVDYRETKSDTSVKFFVTVPGDYHVVVEGTDGFWTDSVEGDVTVGTSGGTSTAFSVVNVTVTTVDEKTVRFDAVTNDARNLQIAYFIVRKLDGTATYDGTEMGRYDGKKRTYTVSTLPAGKYNLQFTATDGVTWDANDPWIEFTVGDTTLNVDSGSATPATGADGEEYLDVSVSVTHNFAIKAAQMDIHDSEGHIIATWKWPGTGDFENHRFRVEGLKDMSQVNYSVFDGVQWKNLWVTIP